MSTPLLILASTSRYRAALLQQMGVPFEIVPAPIDESPLPGESPADTCLRLAQAKARRAVELRWKSSVERLLVIGCDQVLDMDGVAVSKPGSFEVARAQLRQARGRTIICHTALALYDTGSARVYSDVVPTSVSYRDVSDDEIDRYLLAEKPFDCAGSVKVETRGINLLSRVASSDPTALIGLPLIRLGDFLREAGYKF